MFPPRYTPLCEYLLIRTIKNIYSYDVASIAKSNAADWK